MRSTGLMVFGILAMLVLGGCSRRVTIDTVPPGAEIRINGELLGRSPVNVRLGGARWSGTAMQLEASLPGYRTVIGPLDWRYDPRHWYVLLGIFIPPTQLAHAYPPLHRQPLASYVVVLDEDLGDGIDRRRLIHGSDIPATNDDVMMEAP